MRQLFAALLRMTTVLIVLGAVLGATGCAGPRFDSATYSGNQAYYAVNPRCADEFRPCHDGGAR